MATACTGVVGDYNCPQQVGNRVHVLLNAELCARAYGVPLLWHPNIENGLFECDRFLTRSPSVRRADALPPSCSRAEWAYPFSKWPNWRNHVPEIERALRQHDWQPAPNASAYVFCGRMERPVMSAALADSPRAPEPIRGRLRHIFSNGSAYAYGGAFHRLFTFARAADRRRAQQRVDLGIHARINLGSVRSGGRPRQAQLLQNIEDLALSKLPADTPCRAFVASDHVEVALRHLSRLSARCQVKTLQRREDVEERRSIDAGHGRYQNSFISELAHMSGAKLMVGTHGSSASELMAALAAHGGGAVWLCHGRKRGECSDRWEELGA